jgi:hypothetical protein
MGPAKPLEFALFGVLPEILFETTACDPQLVAGDAKVAAPLASFRAHLCLEI